MPDVKVNPYNFAPLGTGPIRTPWSQVTTHERLQETTYSGHLVMRISTLTPLVIPSREDADVDEVLCGCTSECRTKRRMKTTFKRFQHRNGLPFIPATSLKGMARAVFESLTDSCMALFGGTYGTSTYPAPNYKHDLCQKDNGLCPACSVFGTIQGNELLLQGKVRFSDAVSRKEDLEMGEWKLKELSSPKPERHVPFYAKDGKDTNSGPRGWKFYYHHNPKNLVITQSQHNHRNACVKERLKAGAVLHTTLDFHGLTETQMSALLYAVELDLRIEEREGKSVFARTLAHKVGMAKPLGLGSIAITIVDGYIHQGAQRYQNWAVTTSANLRTQIVNLKSKAPTPSSSLKDLLSLKKHEQGSIGYPDKQRGRNAPLGWFDQNPTTPLGQLGVFDQGTPPAIDPHPKISQPSPSLRPEAEATAPVGEPPSVKQDEQAAWLKEVFEKELVLVTQEGKEVRRPRKAYQGKATLLQAGHWFILSGTKTVKPHDRKT